MDNKTTRPNEVENDWKVPSRVVAVALRNAGHNCDDSTVRKVLAGERTDKTDLGQRIIVATQLLEEGAALLLEEVTKVVK